ncbi:MAG: peptidyl-prolyl cis-trans isomerase [Flavobacteriaceae bacterium]|nr:peptidyl-prolyl cis-trans isomerase [Flavobacteriaceae bacterium]
MLKKFIKIIIITSFFFSCTIFPKNLKDNLIARAGNKFLYHSELENKIQYKSISDSIFKSKVIIDNWARDNLLFEKSKINLSDKTLSELNSLVEEYKYDLYIRTYKEFVVKNSIDTLIDLSELKQYYDLNVSNFKLNEELFQFRYISLPKDNNDLDLIKKKFIRFNFNDRQFLDSLSFQFSFFNFNDSIWLKKRDFLKSIKIINEKNYIKFIKNPKFYMVKDSLEVYLLFVKNHLFKKQTPPFSYIKNTIRKIVFNKRKLKFIKEFEKQILKDAIQKNKFETY